MSELQVQIVITRYYVFTNFQTRYEVETYNTVAD